MHLSPPRATFLCSERYAELRVLSVALFPVNRRMLENRFLLQRLGCSDPPCLLVNRLQPELPRVSLVTSQPVVSFRFSRLQDLEMLCL